jgi:hypothetical protein
MISFSTASTNQYLTSVSTYAPFIPGTVCFWFKPTAVNLTRVIFQTSTKFDCRMVAGNIQFRLYRTAAGDTDAVAPYATLVVNTLYHIAATWVTSGANTSIEIFINAVSNVSQANTTNTPVSDIMYIARNSASSTNYLDGAVEDLKFYNRALSLTEIEAIYYSAGNDNIVYGLLNRWPMAIEAQSGSTIAGTGAVKDIIDPNNHFTPAGSPTYSDSYLKLRRRLKVS